MHAVIAECLYQPGSIVCIERDGWCCIIVAAVPHAPVVIGIDMIFRCKDTDECRVPPVHRTAEPCNQQEGLTGTEFPLSQLNPVDLCVLDRGCIDRYSRV